MNKRILFLDIDGVLNSEQYYVHDMESRLDLGQMISHIDPTLVRNLAMVFKYIDGLEVVISSAWRKLFKLEEIAEMFDTLGLPGSKIIGKTPDYIRGQKFSQSCERIDQIKEYIEDNGLDWSDIVIVDDNSLDLRWGKDQKTWWDNRFIQTDGQDGLTYSKASQIIIKFIGQNEYLRSVRRCLV